MFSCAFALVNMEHMCVCICHSKLIQEIISIVWKLGRFFFYHLIIAPTTVELMLTNFSFESNTDATLRLIACSHSAIQLSIVYQVFWILI